MATSWQVDIPYVRLLDHHISEDKCGQEIDSEDGLDKEVSEAEDGREHNLCNPDQEMTDREESSDEEFAVRFK